jgi:hypothetical protein
MASVAEGRRRDNQSETEIWKLLGGEGCMREAMMGSARAAELWHGTLAATHLGIAS